MWDEELWCSRWRRRVGWRWRTILMATAPGTASSAPTAKIQSPVREVPTISSARAARTGSSATRATTTSTAASRATACRPARARTIFSARGQRLRQRPRRANQRPRRLRSGRRRHSRHRRFLLHPGRRRRLCRPELRIVIRWRTRRRTQRPRRGDAGRVGHGSVGHRYPRGGRAGRGGRPTEADQAKGASSQRLPGRAPLTKSPGPPDEAVPVTPEDDST